MSMQVAGLPDGLEFGECKERGRLFSRIKCSVEGTPTETGTFDVEVTLSDDAGGETDKTLKLKIKESRRWWWR